MNCKTKDQIRHWSVRVKVIACKSTELTRKGDDILIFEWMIWTRHPCHLVCLREKRKLTRRRLKDEDEVEKENNTICQVQNPFTKVNFSNVIMAHVKWLNNKNVTVLMTVTKTPFSFLLGSYYIVNSWFTRSALTSDDWLLSSDTKLNLCKCKSFRLPRA